MIFQVISGSSKRSSRKGMENLKVSCFLILAVTALFVADAAVVKTNTGINRIKVIELEDSPKAPADIYEENTGDVRPIERQQTQTPTSDETKKAYGDAIALFNFKAESPQLYFQAIEEVPLDATDILFWNEDVSESPQIPALLSKEAAVLDNGFFGDSEYYTVLAGLQNPLQIDDKVHGENGGLLDWGETLPKSQGALSQEHGQDALVGNTEDRKPPVLKCRKSEGDHVVTVTCKGSCFVWQAQGGIPRRGCTPIKHRTGRVWKPQLVIEYCNTDLCN